MDNFENQLNKVRVIEERIKELEAIISIEKSKLRIEREILEEICFHEYIHVQRGRHLKKCKYCKRLIA